MTNLVSRLRDEAKEQEADWVATFYKPELLVEAADELERLRAALEGGRLLVEKLRVFGNDNVHKYDVPPWLASTKALLRGASEPSGDGEKV